LLCVQAIRGVFLSNKLNVKVIEFEGASDGLCRSFSVEGGISAVEGSNVVREEFQDLYKSIWVFLIPWKR